jgi:hypothetical protein
MDLAAAQMAEFALIFGPQMAKLHEEVKAKQGGRCAACGLRRKLFLDTVGHGLCQTCFTKGDLNG